MKTVIRNSIILLLIGIEVMAAAFLMVFLIEMCINRDNIDFQIIAAILTIVFAFTTAEVIDQTE